MIEHAGSAESTKSTMFGCPLDTKNNIGIENSSEIYTIPRILTTLFSFFTKMCFHLYFLFPGHEVILRYINCFPG